MVWLLLLIVIKTVHLNLTRQHPHHILLDVEAAVGLITTTVVVVVRAVTLITAVAAVAAVVHHQVVK